MDTQPLSSLSGLYAAKAKALQQLIHDESVKDISLHGLVASSAALFFSEVTATGTDSVFLFILNDEEEAGYFFHDLSKVEDREVLFFPSSYRRAVKYGQHDAANEILRTEVLAKIAQGVQVQQPTVNNQQPTVCIITYPEAIAELVVSKKQLDERILMLKVNQTIELTAIAKTLRSFGFQETDYVYEPGQFAIRGSILDIYSFSHELPYRIDFFGDDIDTIRTFEVESQLSKERKDSIEIVPELSSLVDDKIPFLSFLPKNTVLVAKDFRFISDTIARIYDEGFSKQALAERLEDKTEQEQQTIRKEMERERQLCTATEFIRAAELFKRVTLERGNEGARERHSALKQQGSLSFHTTPQPLFHKNFDMLLSTLNDYKLQGYTIYILADSMKQQQRLAEIMKERGSERARERESERARERE